MAAKHAIATGRASRVLILDWDIHHGNGTQDLTYDDQNITYISLHRYANPNGSSYFYPSTGRYDEVGGGDCDSDHTAQGTNINIAWTHGGMGNVEYAAAFAELILPAIAEIQPDLIIVSCGLDAAQGDLIGDCELTPDMYHTMVRSILETAVPNVPIVVALEGGYNVNVIANCMEAVAVALLNGKWGNKDVLDVADQQQQQYGRVNEAACAPELYDDNETQSVLTDSVDYALGDRASPFLPLLLPLTAATLIKEAVGTAVPLECLQDHPQLVATSTLLTSNIRESSDLDRNTTCIILSPQLRRLERGRLVLRQYWNYGKENQSDRGILKTGGARCINQTIDALRKTLKWNNTMPPFRKVEGGKKTPQQTNNPSKRVTRSARKEGTQQGDIRDGLDSLFEGLGL